MSLLHVCTKRKWETSNWCRIKQTCFDFYKVIIREVYTKAYKYSKKMAQLVEVETCRRDITD
jgi:hypothetical protein